MLSHTKALRSTQWALWGSITSIHLLGLRNSLAFTKFSSGALCLFPVLGLYPEESGWNGAPSGYSGPSSFHGLFYLPLSAQPLNSVTW